MSKKEFLYYKLVDNEQLYKINREYLSLIPYLKKITMDKKFSNIEEGKYIELQSYPHTTNGREFLINTPDVHKLITNYIEYWGDKENEKYIKDKRKLFERALISKVIEPFDLNLIYEYINKQNGFVDGQPEPKIPNSLLERNIKNIQIINDLIVNINKLEMSGLSNKLQFLITSFIMNLSYTELQEFNNMPDLSVVESD